MSLKDTINYYGQPPSKCRDMKNCKTQTYYCYEPRLYGYYTSHGTFVCYIQSKHFIQLPLLMDTIPSWPFTFLKQTLVK